MKNIFVGTIFLFVIFNPMVQSQDCCQWSEFFSSIECGLRRSGDQLLFNDVLTSTWTIGIANRLTVSYNNIDVTWWRAELTENWNYLARSVYYPRFHVYSGSINSTEPFTLNITAYGYPTNDIEVPIGSILQQDDNHQNNTSTYHNPKYH